MDQKTAVGIIWNFLYICSMDPAYIDILKQWERNVALPAIYENADRLFPEYELRRINPGRQNDHWASRFKLDMTLPKTRNAEKTVLYRSEMKFREQGEWDNAVGMIDMLMRRERLHSVYEAFSFADSTLGLLMPKPDAQAVKRAQYAANRKIQLLTFLQNCFSAYLNDKQSRNAGAVRAYLRKRGFSQDDTVRFGFGCVPEWNSVIKAVSDSGYSLAEITGVCDVRGYNGRTSVGTIHILSIPYRCAGEIRGFIFRQISSNNKHPKYIVNAGLDRKSVFFNIPKTIQDGRLLVVEGEIDALKANTAGIGNCAAIGGSEISGERKKQIEDAFNRGVKEITLCLDLDTSKNSEEPDLESRYKHVIKSIHTIKDVDIDFDNIYVACLDKAGDPDNYIQENGAEAFRKLVSNALPYWEFIARHKKESSPNSERQKE